MNKFIKICVVILVFVSVWGAQARKLTVRNAYSTKPIDLTINEKRLGTISGTSRITPEAKFDVPNESFVLGGWGNKTSIPVGNKDITVTISMWGYGSIIDKTNKK